MPETTTASESSDPPSLGSEGSYGILVHSIGTAGVSIVSALGNASGVPEQVLALRLFQAPSVLFRSLPKDLAGEAVAILRGAGVECEVAGPDKSCTPGDSEHEVALVVRDFGRMGAVLEAVMLFLGVSTAEARAILCRSPAVLLGRISAATVDAIERRFKPLGVDVDVSRPATSNFDVLIGPCSAEQRAAAITAVKALGIAVKPASTNESNPLLAMGISHRDAERLHGVASRSKWPLVIVNREFQRYDVRLDTAQDTPQLRTFLAETANMPERVIPKVLARLPIVTHPCVTFPRMGELLESMRVLGASASGHLLTFQTFSLRITQVGDIAASKLILRGIGGLSEQAAELAITRTKEVKGPLSSTLARWLRHELDRAGTKSRMGLL